MKKIDKKAVPLNTLKDIKNLMDELHKICRQHSDSIQEIETNEFLFEAKDIDPSSTFFFKVINGQKTKDHRIFFQYEFAPFSSVGIEKVATVSERKNVVLSFNNWVSLLNEYNAFTLTNDDEFQKKYEEEFDDLFDIVDEDAEVNPFDLERQIFIYKYLQAIISKLEISNKIEYTPLIEDAKSLQADLPNQTKKTTVKRLSKLFAKIRKAGIKLLLDFYDVGKKELLKRAFNGGLHEMGHLLDNIF